MIIWVQVDEVQDYDEDQITLVIPDLSNFVVWVPMILGTPMISCHECDKGNRDRHPGDALGKRPGGLSFGSLMSYNHSGRQ